MQNFIDLMENEINDVKSFTTNGAVAYATSGKKLTDFFFGLSAMRSMSQHDIACEYERVFFENKMKALELMFYIADIREGAGERNAFRSCLGYLARRHPKIAIAVAELVPYYNRWDSILVLLGCEETRNKAVEVIKKQLSDDLENMEAGNPVSLCAKWMPSCNASSKDTKAMGRLLVNSLGWTERHYRKVLSKLRGYLDVVEVKMSAKEWGNINYEAVPSKANLIYRNAFMRHDADRRIEYLQSLVKGDTKINAGVLQPHEIISKYIDYDHYDEWSMEVKKFDTTLEELWKSLPDLSVENTLVVRDGSGSMSMERVSPGSTPLDVATALSIYMAEHNTGIWKDRFITFSSRPRIVDLSNCDTLADKVSLSMKEVDYSNTDIYKTMMLVLDTAKKNHLEQQEMPNMIVICSDMQFDGDMFNLDKSLFDEIAEEYKDAGYKLPKICFWNISGHINGTIPMQQNEMGLILCSGFSVQILNMFMSNSVDPYKAIIEALENERYNMVRDAVAGML